MRVSLFRLAIVGFLLAFAGAAGAQTTMQFPTTPWGGFAPGIVQCGQLLRANMNTTADQAVQVSVPSVLNGGGAYGLLQAVLSNASISLTVASGGLYTGASQTGTTLAANQAFSTLTAAAINAAGSAVSLTMAVGATTSMLNAKTVYLNLTTAQGAAATADLRLYCYPMY